MAYNRVKRCYSRIEARDYFGVSREFFETEIAPHVEWFPVGDFDVAEVDDLDQAWDDYVSRQEVGGEDDLGPPDPQAPGS